MGRLATIAGLGLGVVLLLAGAVLFAVCAVSGFPLWGLYMGGLPFVVGFVLTLVCASHHRRWRRSA